jgi:hypothetical protein
LIGQRPLGAERPAASVFEAVDHDMEAVLRLFCALAAALVLGACGGETARDALEASRQALADARYADAIASADAGLSRSPDERTGWGLELVKLEALARDGRGDATLAQLEKLAAARPESVSPDQYTATADQLRAAGRGADAIRVLDQGLRRFPGNPTLTDLIEAAKAGPEPGSDELEMLRSLGYVE